MGLMGGKGGEAQRRREEDERSAGELPALLGEVAEARALLDAAQRSRASAEELRAAGTALDDALTRALRAAYARERVLVGARGYTDRIRRRKRLARPDVREATELAERLLTERERHRLHGVARVPRSPAGV
ncbi:hypothetical protein [Nocardiopsis coralliicola]